MARALVAPLVLAALLTALGPLVPPPLLVLVALRLPVPPGPLVSVLAALLAGLGLLVPLGPLILVAPLARPTKVVPAARGLLLLAGGAEAGPWTPDAAGVLADRARCGPGRRVFAGR